MAYAPDHTDFARSADAGETAIGVRILSADELNSPAFLRQWEALARQAGDPNPFYEHWFLLPSLQGFDPDGRVQIIAHFQANQLTGLMPLSRSNNYYGYPLPHFSNWFHDNIFCAVPLIAVGHEEAFWRDLLTLLDATAGTSLFFHARLLPEDSLAAAALKAVTREHKRQSVLVERKSRALLASDLSPDAYLDSALSKKHRKELNRHRRRLGEAGVLEFEKHVDAQDIGGWINDYLALEASGWKGEIGSAIADQPALREFFVEAIRGAASAGRLERLALTLNKRRIAMLATFHCPPAAYSFKTAFDEDLAKHSPGMLLQLENLTTLDNEDIMWTDSCAAPGHPMIERLWQERRALVSRNIALGGRLRRAIARPLLNHESIEDSGS
ncbi:MAG: GNAT family N-acetyltransferase [Pseudomonadota bacterium]|nr:GNAT family N-acetyltransferase [Pseudomonadota bacterium]